MPICFWQNYCTENIVGDFESKAKKIREKKSSRPSKNKLLKLKKKINSHYKLILQKINYYFSYDSFFK